MRIVSMTATFGCLEAKTITFQPGLNVICAPNEWGKSTWCDFLMAMFYGIDTRQRSKAGLLADKERYAPWSGKGMGGSVDLIWQGRAITIERYTQGRIPMGAFRAYETDSGLQLQELTAENCGLQLLGVERGVFARSGFITAGNLALTPDEDLLRRLQRLVTTGDDSPQVAALEGKLRDVKNKCRHNQTGAIPQTKQELNQCLQELERQRERKAQADALQTELRRQRQWREKLRRHASALRAKEDREKLAELETARQAESAANDALTQAETACRELPTMAHLTQKLEELKQVRRERRALELEFAMTPVPHAPEPPECFAGLTPEEAEEKAKKHLGRLEELRENAARGGGGGFVLAAVALLLAGLGGVLLLPGIWRYLAAIPGAAGLLLLALGIRKSRGREKARRNLALYEARLEELYGEEDPLTLAEDYKQLNREAETRQRQRLERFTARRQTLEQRERELNAPMLEQAMDCWNNWSDAVRASVRAKAQRKALEKMAGGMVLAQETGDDELTLTPEQTRAELDKAETTCAGLTSRLDGCMGQLRALPSVEELELKRQALESRLEELEKWYSATVCALELLGQARRELQSRFAPRISREAGKILATLTGGKYGSLLLEQDFTLLSRGEDESTARELTWRSLGTREQMYLAARLAVCRVMLADAPIILDDALSHFDDERMAAALACLAEQGQQVILFSCQSRERQWLETRK